MPPFVYFASFVVFIFRLSISMRLTHALALGACWSSSPNVLLLPMLPDLEKCSARTRATAKMAVAQFTCQSGRNGAHHVFAFCLRQLGEIMQITAVFPNWRKRRSCASWGKPGICVVPVGKNARF